MALRITCKEATELKARSAVESIPVFDNARLQLHIAVCKLCRVYDMQMEFITKGVKSVAQATLVEIPSTALDRIQSRLHSEHGFPKQ